MAKIINFDELRKKPIISGDLITKKVILEAEKELLIDDDEMIAKVYLKEM